MYNTIQMIFKYEQITLVQLIKARIKCMLNEETDRPGNIRR